MEKHQTKPLSNILLGILIGVLGSYLFFKATNDKGKIIPQAQEINNYEAPKVQIESPPSSIKRAKRMVHTEPSNIESKLEDVPRKTQIVSTPQNPQKKKQVLISLSSFDIERLEGAWNDLRQQVEIRHEGHGWRISKVAPDSLFSTTGFQEGDLITEEALISYFGDETEEDLATRVIHIFEHVSR